MFAREGANVAINYVSSEGKSRDLAAMIVKEHGVKAIVVQGVGSVLVAASGRFKRAWSSHTI